MNATAKDVEVKPLKLDFGCGKNKREGFHGVDEKPFEGVDTVMNIIERVSYKVRVILDGATTPEVDSDYVVVEAYPPGPPQFKSWPWADESVDEAHASHFVEHLHNYERVHFFNELYRVLKWGAVCMVIVPAWSHDRAYGDPTHQWPPVSGWMPLYLNKAWRDPNGPHTGYTCDFDTGVAANWDAWLQTRSQDVKVFAMSKYLNSTTDWIFTVTKTKR